MTSEQAKRVKIGDRIKWQSLDDSVEPTYGRVSFVGYNGFEVKWNDGEESNQKFNEPERLCCFHLVLS